jgi:phosphatidylserine/phosphatidylglycerophosphate/cardiolipin synthase-like enzyme
MFSLRKANATNQDSLLSSQLFDQGSFYKAFIRDLSKAKREVIIESPFISSRRIALLLPEFSTLINCGVKVIVNTKPIEEHAPDYSFQAIQGIADLQQIGVNVLYTGGHHRRLAVIDKRVSWEGSLNILSQNDSCEIMRRMCSEQLANQLIAFLKLEKYLT